MELLCKYGLVMFTICLLYCSQGKVQASPVGDSLAISNFDSKSLINFGKALDKPILTLLGMTLEQQEEKTNRTIQHRIERIKEETKERNDNFEETTNDDSQFLKKIQKVLKRHKQSTSAEIEAMRNEFLEENKILKSELCKMKSCSEWTGWSMCSAKEDTTFGVSFRSRTCGMNSQICTSKSVVQKETEKTICRGKHISSACPATYTLTPNQFCIRVRNDVNMTWEDAQYTCHQDGGYLINIDSDLKAEDVAETLETISFEDYTYFWIDGRTTPQNTTWHYEYGSENIGLSLWYSGEPGWVDTHIIYHKISGKWLLDGVRENVERYFICELV